MYIWITDVLSTALRNRAELNFFYLQEREQKQKLLDPTPVRISQRFSGKHINQEEKVCLFVMCTCFLIVYSIADCRYTTAVATFLKRQFADTICNDFS